jgi:hypothetical protein
MIKLEWQLANLATRSGRTATGRNADEATGWRSRSSPCTLILFRSFPDCLDVIEHRPGHLQRSVSIWACVTSLDATPTNSDRNVEHVKLDRKAVFTGERIVAVSMVPPLKSEIENRRDIQVRKSDNLRPDMLLATLDPRHEPRRSKLFGSIIAKQRNHPLVDRENEPIDFVRQSLSVRRFASTSGTAYQVYQGTYPFRGFEFIATFAVRSSSFSTTYGQVRLLTEPDTRRCNSVENWLRAASSQRSSNR